MNSSYSELREKMKGVTVSVLLLLANGIVSLNIERRRGRQLDFDSDIGEKTEKQIFGQRITTTERQTTNRPKLKQLESNFNGNSNNRKIFDQSYLPPSRDYLPSRSDKPPQVKNILNLDPPFNPGDSPSRNNENFISTTINPQTYSNFKSSTPYSTQKTTYNPFVTSTNNLFDIISCKSGSFGKECKNDLNSPLQRFNPFQINEQFKNNRNPPIASQKETNLNNQYLPPIKSTPSEPVPTNKEYLPPFTSRPSEPAAPSNINKEYLPPTTGSPIKQEPTNLNNEYLPPVKNKPLQQGATNLNNQYLPPVKPTENDPNIEPAAAIENPTVIKPAIEKKENYSLERLCNDPFHSFLCTGATKQRERITGRLRPQAKIPPEVLNRLSGEASFQDTRTALPERPKVTTTTLKPSTTRVFALPKTKKQPENDINSQPASNPISYLPPIPQPTTNQRSYLPPQNEKFEKPKDYVLPAPAFNQKAYLPPSIPKARKPEAKENLSPQSAIDQKSYLPPPQKNNNNVVPQPTYNENIYLPPYESQNSDRSPNTINIPSTKITNRPYSRTTPSIQTSTRQYTSSYTTPRTTINVFISPEPSQNSNLFRIPDEKFKTSNGYVYPKPFPSFNSPTLGSDSSNIKENKVLPLSPKPVKPSVFNEKDKIEPASAQNPESVAQFTQVKGKEREHTLEELCNDAFHSFLCQAPRQRQRITGRLRPKAQIPKGIITPEGSSIEETKQLPQPTNTDEQKLKPEGYIYPQPSENNQFLLPTTRQPTIIPRPTTVKPKDDSYYYPQPSEDKVFTLPTKNPYVSPTTITTTVPFETPKANGYFYPQPSENQQFILPTTSNPTTMPKDDGYIYPQPSEDKQFRLPLQKPSTSKEDGYVYPQPSEEKQFRLPTTRNPVTIPPPKDDGYLYPQPSEDNQFTLPTRKPITPSTSKANGYIYPQPSEQKQLKLPITTSRKPPIVTNSYTYSYSQSTTKKYTSEYSPQPSENLNKKFSPSNGYNYQKPARPFNFPTTTLKPIPTTPVINYPEPSNNQEQVTGLASDNNGYSYRKPTQQLRLPSFGRKDEELPSPSSNDQTVLIPKNVKTNKTPIRPTVKTTVPTTITKTENIQPAAAQNPLTLVQLLNKPKDQHTLEEQCSHAFHSFLCNSPGRRRPRPNGRLYGEASNSAAKTLSGESSNSQFSKIKPDNNEKNSNIVPEPSANQEQAVPFNGYNYRKPSSVFTFPTTAQTTVANYVNEPSYNLEQKVNQPSDVGYSYPVPSTTVNFYTTTEYPTTTQNFNSENPLNFGESKESSINNGYNYDKPLQPFNFPTKTSPNLSQTTIYTTSAPTTTDNPVYTGIDIRSQSSVQNPTLYPQPSGNQNIQITSSPTADYNKGYFYNKPSNQLQLPFENYESPKFSQSSLPSTYFSSNLQTSSTTVVPNVSSNSDLALAGIKEDQFPFSFFKKASKKPKSQEPLPPDSELIILKL